MMKIRTRGKGTIDRRLRGSMGTLDDMNPTRLSKRSQAVPLQYCRLRGSVGTLANVNSTRLPKQY